mmetsp:Transcript_31526/g.74932  ORF Transcript_31526/g.74932 Transcript_31526/m.74932 type:complete len:320 (-) Transcript_31526:40-999(-)
MRVARTLFLSLLPLLAASTLASGMATVTLRGVNGASAEVAMHGAHVISFTPDDKSKPVIYTSPTAKFDSASAIRGGIPICFPQFGPRGALPAHGFSRKSDDWTLVSTDADLEEKNGSPAKAEFRLADTEATRASAWPHPFEALYQVSICDGALRTSFKVTNKGEEDFTFTCALHTYFACGSLNAAVIGLKGSSYEDSLQGGKVLVEEGDVTFAGEVDRVYGPTPDEVKVSDPDNARSLVLTKDKTFPDMVVWNPWIEKAKEFGDLPDEAYADFVCAEVGAIREPVSLKAGETWEAAQSIRVEEQKRKRTEDVFSDVVCR